jgi:hypothetical protein
VWFPVYVSCTITRFTFMQLHQWIYYEASLDRTDVADGVLTGVWYPRSDSHGFLPTTVLLNMDLRFEVFITVAMKRSIFWDITACSPLKVNWHFGGNYRLHLQGRKIGRTWHMLSPCFLARLILWFWRWRRYVPPKRRLTFNGLQGVISHSSIKYGW